jgi:hypothetical protein
MIDYVLIAQIIGGVVGSLYIAQTYYLAVMSLARAKAAGLIVPGTWQSFWFALWLVPGLFVDWFLNMTLFSILFIEPPQGYTNDKGERKYYWFAELITGRLKRHCGRKTWRGAIARFICHGFLDKFDPRGRHC